jgi:hypothetical protein
MRSQIGISFTGWLHLPPGVSVEVRRIVGHSESHSWGSSTTHVAVTAELGSLTSRTPCTV